MIRSLFISCLILFSQPSQAWQWQDLWLNQQQQGKALLQQQPATAAQHFATPQWRGVANYKAGQYAEAIEDFAQVDDPAGRYNLGNAQARAGDLQQALQTYQQLLENQNLESGLRADVQFNHDLLESLLRQEQQSPRQDSDNPDEQSGQDSQQSQQSRSDNSDSAAAESTQPDSGGSDSQSEDSQAEAANAGESQGDQQQHQADAEQAQGQAQQQAQNEEQDMNQAENASGMAAAEQAPMSENQQATEQWLRQIPDDPAGLLRRKLLQSHRTQYPNIRDAEAPW